MDASFMHATGGSDAAVESPRSSRRAASLPQAEQVCPKPEWMHSPVAEALVQRLKASKYNPTDEQGALRVRQAYAIAYEAHDGQKRASGEPYIDHPVAVAHILIDLGLDADTIAAALLHDVVEDTAITLSQVEQLFGHDIAHLVDGVTKLTGLENQTKEDAQANTYRKMFIAMADDPRVILVKLADRMHNMRTISVMKPESQQRTARETLDIYAPLAHRLGIWQLKWELEDRSFAVLYPEKYQEIKRALNARRQERERTVQRVIAKMQQALEKEGIAAEITGRPKHIYSIYRKMERKNVSFDQIYDQLAVRVIVDTVAECYRVLGIVHATWPPVPGEFDDYIARPKESLYQSLHTTVLIPGGQPCEVQIRTHEMHEVAERGIAAHWHYKEGFGRRDPTFETKLAWLRNLIVGRHELSAPEFVETLKSEELEEQVYVLSPKGKIVELPVGSTPVDFAYRIHSQVGNSCAGAKVNNRIVPLDYQLENGDIVQIITTKTGRGPSRDWLNFVKTSGARSHIRRYFKKQRREENEAAGRDMLEKELKRLGLNAPFDQIAQLYGLKDIQDLFAQIGSGDLSARAVVQKVLAQEVKEEPALADLPQVTPQPERRATEKGIRVRGVDGVMTRLAKCCNPVAGEPIVGYVTRGRGVTIHRADCRAILNEPDQARLVDVAWGEARQQQGYPVPVRIEAWDRVGLWRDITNAVADADINIERVDQLQIRKDGRAVLMVILTIHSIAELTTILDKLNRLPDVIIAHRENSGAAPNT
jgi:guanosine-3',5'-bis(diphosphate) 3'-pyrophosphohydrolase